MSSGAARRVCAVGGPVADNHRGASVPEGETAATRISVVGSGVWPPCSPRSWPGGDFYEYRRVRRHRRGEGAASRRPLRLRGRFAAAKVDATNATQVADVARAHDCDIILNAADPRFVMPVFLGALEAGVNYMDMAMSLEPHPQRPYEEGREEARRRSVRDVGLWEDRGCSPSSASASSRERPTCSPGTRPTICSAASTRAFATVRTSRSRARLRADVLDLDHDRGASEPSGDLGEGLVMYPPAPFSEPERFSFPEGIGEVECVNVEREEVLLVPRWVDCRRVRSSTASATSSSRCSRPCTSSDSTVWRR